MYMGHQPGNVPLALSERQSDLRRIHVAPPVLPCFHGVEQRPSVSGNPTTLFLTQFIALPPSFPASCRVPHFLSGSPHLHPSFHYHHRHLHITSEMWLASNCWLAHSPLSFLSLSNYSHLNNPLTAARWKKWGFLHRPPLALHSLPCFFLLSHFSFDKKKKQAGGGGGVYKDGGGWCEC